MIYKPKALAITAVRQAMKLPKTFFPVPSRTPEATTEPCFIDRTTQQECSWALAGRLMRSVTEEDYITTVLTAYVSACRKTFGSGLTEALYEGLGMGPLLPPPSLFAPLDDTVEEIITGLGRTLLKLRERYELVLPRTRPLIREVEQGRVVVIDHVKFLVRQDPERARAYIDRLQRQLTLAFEKPSRPPPSAV